MNHLRYFFEKHNHMDFDDIDTEEHKFKKGDIVLTMLPCNYGVSYFMNNNCGELISYEFDQDGIRVWNIKYRNIPKHMLRFTRFMGSFPKYGLKQTGGIFVAKENKIRHATNEEIFDCIRKINTSTSESINFEDEWDTEEHQNYNEKYIDIPDEQFRKFLIDNHILDKYVDNYSPRVRFSTVSKLIKYLFDNGGRGLYFNIAFNWKKSPEGHKFWSNINDLWLKNIGEY